MNAVVSQTQRCLIQDSKNIRSLEILLTTVEMVINSLLNQSTGFSPFYLNYGHEPVMPIQLLWGNEMTSIESVASFVRRVTSDWELARENLQTSVGLQQKCYDHRHMDIHYKVGDLVLLSTGNLKMKGTPGKLQRRFVRPFQVVEAVGQQAYRLSFPKDWKIHLVFHVSLLKTGCGVSSVLQLQHDSLCRFLGTSGECAQNLQNLHKTRQMTATTTKITEGVKTEVERQRKTRSSAAGDQDHQLQCITGLVNEQESQ